MKKFSVKGKIYYFIVITIISIVAFMYAINSNNYFFYGFSVSAFMISILMIIKNFMILKDPKKLKTVEIENNDERNIMITVKSYAITFRIFIVVEAIASIVFAVFNEMLICDVLAYSIFVQLLIYLVVRVIISKKI